MGVFGADAQLYDLINERDEANEKDSLTFTGQEARRSASDAVYAFLHTPSGVFRMRAGWTRAGIGGA